MKQREPIKRSCSSVLIEQRGGNGVKQVTLMLLSTQRESIMLSKATGKRKDIQEGIPHDICIKV